MVAIITINENTVIYFNKKVLIISEYLNLDS
jgi:hypothetical protein